MDWFQEMIDEPAKFRGITTDVKRIVNGLLEMEKPIIGFARAKEMHLTGDMMRASEAAAMGTFRKYRIVRRTSENDRCLVVNLRWCFAGLTPDQLCIVVKNTTNVAAERYA